MALPRWVFHDPHNGETWVVPLNPNKMSSPFPKKNVTARATTGAGQGLVFEGQAPPFDWQFGGVILEKAHLDQLEKWAAKKNRVRITDHYGRTWSVYLTDFDATPVEPSKAITYKWRHEYTVHAIMFGRVA